MLLNRDLQTKRSVRRSKSSRLHLSRHALVMASLGVVGIGTAARAQNTVSVWTGPAGTATAPATGFWNTSSNWIPAAVPASSSSTELDFGGSTSTAYTATNNIGTGTFTLTEMQFNSTASVTETIAASAAANTLTFVANGSTNPIINQNNTGAFNISAGLILGNNLTIGGTGTGALNFSGVINGSGGVTISTANTVTFSGANLYTGATTISSGQLQLTGSLAASPVSVLSGATLDTVGTAVTIGSVTGTTGLNLAGGGTLNMANGPIQTLTLNSTAATTAFTAGMGSFSTLNVLYGDKITTPGSSSIGSLNVNFSGLPGQPGYTLLNSTGGLNLTGALTINGTTSASTNVDGYTISLVNTSTGINVAESSAPPVAYWNGTTDGTWTYYNGGATNWVNGPTGSELGIIPGAASDVFFTSNSAGNLSTTLGSNYSINSLTFTGTGTSAGSAPVTIAGPGSLTINALAGATYNAGTGIVVQSGSAAHTISANVVLGNSQSWSNNSVSPLTLSGGVSGISTASLSLTGNFNFSGASTYSGTTTVNTGTVNFTGAAASSGNGSLDLGHTVGNTVVNINTTGTLSFGTNAFIGDVGSAAVIQTAGTAAYDNNATNYLTIGDGGYGYYQLSGGTVTSGSTASAGGVRVGLGIGVLLQTGGTFNTYRYMAIGEASGSAVATFTGGTFNEANASYRTLVGDGASATATLNIGTLAGGNAVYYPGGTGIYLAAGASDNSTLNLDSGTLNITSSGIIRSTTTGTTGVVNLNGATIASSVASTLINNTPSSVNVFNGGVTFNVSGSVTDVVSANMLAANGNGVFPAGGSFAVTNGGSGYIGAPIVTVFGGGGTGATAIANMSNGSVVGVILTNPGQGYTSGQTLTFNFSGGGATSPASSYAVALAGSNLVTNGTGGITKIGTGILSLTGASTYAGPTLINGGELSLGSSGALGSTSLISFGGGSLQYTSANTNDYSNKFSTAAGQAYSIDTNGQEITFGTALSSVGGSLTKLGSGSLTLAAPATYSGATTVTAGTLIVPVGSSLASSTVSIASGATANLQPGSGSMTIGSGAGSLTVAGGGTLDMTDGATGTLNIVNSGTGAGLTLGSATTAANLVFEIGGSTSDNIAVTGAASLAAGGSVIRLEPLSGRSTLTASSYTLVSATGGLNNASNFSLTSPVFSTSSAIYDVSLSHTATSEILNISQDLSSASLYWAGTVDSVWNTISSGTSNWNTDAGSGTNSGTIPGPATNVYFTINGGGANAGATTLGANTSINSLNFPGTATGPVGIGGSNSLTIYASASNGNPAGAGITMQPNSVLDPVTISAPVVLGGSQTWTNNDSNTSNALIVSGNVSGPFQLSTAGVGAITLSGANTFTGGLNATSGTLNLNSPAALGTGTFVISGGITLDNTNTSGGTVTLAVPSQQWNSSFTFNGTNNLNLGSGTVTLGGNVAVTLTAKTLGINGPVTDGGAGYTLSTTGAGNLNVSGAITGATGLNVSGTGIVNITGAQTYTGQTAVNGGILQYTGAGTNLGNNTNSGLTINNGTVLYSSSGTSTFNNSGNPFIIGGNTGQGGALIVTSGTLNMLDAASGNGYLQLGNNGGYGFVEVTGGTLNAGDANNSTGFRVGSGTGTTGMYLQTGGSMTSHRYFVIGSGSGLAAATFTGGTAALGTDGLAVYLGETNTGIMNIGTEAGGNAVVTAASATASNGGIRMTTANGDSSFLNLDSGTLVINTAGIYSGVTSPHSVVNLNGGVLMPGTTNLDLIPNNANAALSSTSNYQVSSATIYNGGAVINTNGSNASISSPLTGATGNGIYKNAAFTATPTGAAGSGYIGTPWVTVSGGNGTGAQALANVDLNPADTTYGQITGFTMTDPGQGYSSGDTLTFTLQGGTSSAGTAAAPYYYTLASGDVVANNGGLTKLGAGTLTLSGSNSYTGTTNVSAGTLQINTGGAIGSGPVVLGSNTAVNFNSTLPLSVPGAISGAGSVQQINTGTTAFGGASTYTGATNISAGKFVLTNTASLGNTAITVAGGATFNPQTGMGTMNIGSGSASLILAPGSNFDMTDGATGILNLNGGSGTALTIGAATGAPVKLTFEVGNSSVDQLQVTGNASVLASGASINLSAIQSDSSFTPGTYTLITASGGLGSNFNLVDPSINVAGTLYDLTLNSSAKVESVTFTTDTTTITSEYWAGAIDNNWSTKGTSGTNWRTDASGSTDPGVVPSAQTNVFFTVNSGGANLATTLGSNFSINTLSFTSAASGPVSISNYTLTINNSTTLDNAQSGAGITLQNGAPQVTINSNIFLGGDQTWVNNSSNGLLVNGSVGGPQNLTVGGSGAITLAGSNTFANGLTAVGGTLNINNPAALGTGTFAINGAVVLDNTTGAPITINSVPQAWNSSFSANNTSDLNLGAGNVSLGTSVTVTVNAGTLTVGGTITDNNLAYTLTGAGPGTLNLTGSITGATTLVVSGPGSVNLSGPGSTYTGNTNVAAGTLNVTGAAGYTGNGALLVGVSGSAAIANFNSSGTLNYTQAAAIGYGSGSGAVYQNNGTVNLTPNNGSLLSLGGAGYLELGVNVGSVSTSYGYYAMGGGTLNLLSATGVRVGDGGYGVFTQTGGVINLSRYFAMTSPGNGAQSDGYSVASFLGGVFNGPTGGYNVRIADDAYGISVLNVGSQAGGSGLVNLTGSTDGGLFELTDGNSISGSYGIANLNAGTVRFNGALGLFKGSYYTNANLSSGAIVDLNGATLQAGVNGVNFIDNTVDAAYVYNGNAVFDTNNHSGGVVNANLQPAQGNGIYTATFNLPAGSQGAGYIGAPIVTLNGGSDNNFGQQQLADAIANVVNGQLVSVTITNPGQGYNVGDTLNFSFAGGAATNSASYSYTLTAADLAANNGGVVKNGLGDLTLNGTNSYLGASQVNAGTLIFGTPAAMPVDNNLSIASGATAVAGAHNAGSPALVYQVGTLTNSGILDVKNNAVIIANGSIGSITSQLATGYNAGNWNGTGGAIESSLAAMDSTHLTAVGSATGFTSFEGMSVSPTDLLLKYTYYGDADLNGEVDGSDYSRIDNGYLQHLTGWQNGDFNYDGVINGSDYTLIDNAYNMQGAQLSSEVAAATAQIAEVAASSAVPEPASLGIIAFTAIGLLGRRRRTR
jgi:fibronectin-binding autotransporter adhesin